MSRPRSSASSKSVERRARARPRPRRATSERLALARSARGRWRDRAGRYRDAAGRNARRGGAPACPCRTPPARRWRYDHEKRAPSPAMRRLEGGKARRDHALASSTVMPRRARKAHDEEAHGDAMVEMRRDHAAARHLAGAAGTIRSSPSIAQSTPAAARPAAMAASRSDSLTRSSAEAAHARFALGESRGDGEDRIFVDHRRRALGRNIDAAQSRGAHAQIGDALRRPRRADRAPR